MATTTATTQGLKEGFQAACGRSSAKIFLRGSINYKTKRIVSYMMELFLNLVGAMSGKLAGTRTKRAAGRPRSEASRASILTVAFAFLRSKPVPAISTVHIARKAGVSTATVYRWWPTKEALLLDAFLNAVNHELVLTDEESPMMRLRKYFLQIGRFFTGDNGIVAARLLAAIQDDPKLHTHFMERICTPREMEIRAIVQKAIELRQLPAEMEVSLFLDMILGPLLARLLFRHELIDEPFVAAVFDQAVAGAVAASGATIETEKSRFKK